MPTRCCFAQSLCPAYDAPGCMAEIGIFHGLEAAEKARVRMMTRKEIKGKGETIFTEGEHADTVYLVIAGQAKLHKLSSAGKELIIGFLRPPALCGMEAMGGEETERHHIRRVHPKRLRLLRDNSIAHL